MTQRDERVDSLFIPVWRIDMNGGNMRHPAELWNDLVSRLITAGVERSQPRSLERFLTELAGRDAAAEHLRGWVPDPRELERLRKLYGLVPRPGCWGRRPGTADEMNRLLAGLVGPWLPLKRLASASFETPPPTDVSPRKPGKLIGAPRPERRATLRRPSLIPPRDRQASGRAAPPVAGMDSLVEHGTHYAIYLDESWCQRAPNRGVLAGIIRLLDGKSPGSTPLPQIPTHLLQDCWKQQDAAQIDKARGMARRAIDQLLATPECRVLVMMVDAGNDVASTHYGDVVADALALLLGWLMRRTRPQGRFDVFLEQEGGRPEGYEGRQWLDGRFESLKRANPERLGQWKLGDVQWKGKEFGLIPYADLVAYIASPYSTGNRWLADEVAIESWPGYIPLSLDLVLALQRIESIEAGENVRDVLDMARHLTRPGLVTVCRDLIRRFKSNPRLREVLLRELDERYRRKDRNLEALRPQVELAWMLAPPDATGEHHRARLHRAAIAFQAANHAGDPERIRDAAGAYQSIRAAAVAHDRELTTFVDLNLAVHHADQFEFTRALVTMEDVRADEGFRFLSPLMQGRVESSIGQYLSMHGRYVEAENRFSQALGLFDHADVSSEERRNERNQTGCYRAINAIDGEISGIDAIVETLAPGLNHVTLDPYRHHVLLRYFWSRRELREKRRTYLDARGAWITGGWHPWELIAMYRALFLLEVGDQDGADEQFDVATGIALGAGGATLRLIGSMIAVLACCHGLGDRFARLAREQLAGLRGRLPAAAQRIDSLETALADPRLEREPDVLGTLPFNFH